MAELSIKISIANRVYPLKINTEEEEAIRMAVKLIGDKLKEYEENYSVKDKQDLLAMCALQFATEQVKNGQEPDTAVVTGPGLEEKLNDLESLLSQYTQRNHVL